MIIPMARWQVDLFLNASGRHKICCFVSERDPLGKRVVVRPEQIGGQLSRAGCRRGAGRDEGLRV